MKREYRIYYLINATYSTTVGAADEKEALKKAILECDYGDLNDLKIDSTIADQNGSYKVVLHVQGTYWNWPEAESEEEAKEMGLKDMDLGNLYLQTWEVTKIVPMLAYNMTFTISGEYERILQAESKEEAMKQVNEILYDDDFWHMEENIWGINLKHKSLEQIDEKSFKALFDVELLYNQGAIGEDEEEVLEHCYDQVYGTHPAKLLKNHDVKLLEKEWTDDLWL